MNATAIVEKLNELPPERVAEVVDFIDFLRQREQSNQKTEEAVDALGGMARAEAAELRFRLSAFAEDWDKPEMNIYDDYDKHKAALEAES